MFDRLASNLKKLAVMFSDGYCALYIYIYRLSGMAMIYVQLNCI